MRFPIREVKANKEAVESDMIDMFKEASSWEEFCLKVTTKYGIDVSGIFNKWHIAYFVINRFNVGIFQLIWFIFSITVAIAASMAFAYAVDGYNVVSVLGLVVIVCVTIGYSFTNILKFGEFTDNLQGIQYYC